LSWKRSAIRSVALGQPVSRDRLTDKVQPIRNPFGPGGDVMAARKKWGDLAFPGFLSRRTKGGRHGDNDEAL
jgi:hypothetical protein